jgi:hypothetical protein
MKIDPIIVAFIALAGVIISALISKLISGRTLYINAVTVERSKWIDRLRENIATCSGHLRTLSYLTEVAEIRAAVVPINLAEQDALVKEINKLISLISLQLNPFGEIDRNIISILARMPALANSRSGEKLRTADDLLIKHSQWLLKTEWEKVKSETRGFVLRRWAAIKACCHIHRYRQFCKSAGSLSAL